MAKRYIKKGTKAISKDYTLAKVYFDKAIQLEEGLDFVYEYRGIMHGLLGDFDSMAIDLLQAELLTFFEDEYYYLEVDSFDDQLTFCKNRFRIGSLYYYLKKDEIALLYLMISLEDNPISFSNYIVAIEEKYDIYIELDFSYRKMYLETLVLCSEINYDSGDIYRSLYYCFKIIEDFPRDLSGYYLLNKSLLKLGDSLSYKNYLKEFEMFSDKLNTNDNSADEIFIKRYMKKDSMMHDIVMEDYKEDMNDLFYGLNETIKNKYPRFNLDSLNELTGK